MKLTFYPPEWEPDGRDARQEPRAPGEDESEYLFSCRRNLCGCEYLYKLGISETLAEDYLIGFDGLFPFGCPYKAAKGCTGGKRWDSLIIPSMSAKGVYSFTAVNTRNGETRKIGTSFPFGISSLYWQEPAFVTLSEIDALTVMSNGAAALALGELGNVGFLLAYMRKHGAELPRRPLILALGDDNEAEREKAARMAGQLRQMGIPYLLADKEIYRGRVSLTAARSENARDFSAAVKHALAEAAKLNDKEPDKGKEA